MKGFCCKGSDAGKAGDVLHVIVYCNGHDDNTDVMTSQPFGKIKDAQLHFVERGGRGGEYFVDDIMIVYLLRFCNIGACF